MNQLRFSADLAQGCKFSLGLIPLRHDRKSNNSISVCERSEMCGNVVMVCVCVAKRHDFDKRATHKAQRKNAPRESRARTAKAKCVFRRSARPPPNIFPQRVFVQRIHSLALPANGKRLFL
jgi:hypothetical protein